MDVYKVSIYDFLFATQDKFRKFNIPIYQRPYSWQKEHCQKLYEDIQNVNIASKRHYLGAIVCKRNGSLLNEELDIIDGQQRITSLILFILACASKNNLDLSEIKKVTEKIEIVNDEDNKALNLLFNKLNDKTFNKFDLSVYKNSNIYENFNNFKDLIEKKLDLENLNLKLKNIELVSIILDKDDDAQLIFECMNSTGKSLTFMELIKNSILMNLTSEKQIKIYENFWKEIELYFLVNKNDQINSDKFFKYYLQIKTNRDINEKNIFKEFRKNFNYVDDEEKEKTIKEINYYFKIFKQINEPNINQLALSETVLEALSKIQVLEFTVTNPFLMQLIFNHLENKEFFDENKVIQIINDCTTFLVRRAFCGKASSFLNKVFLTFTRKIDEDHSEWHKSINSKFYEYFKKGDFPKDDEFEEKFKSINFYKMKIKKHILNQLNNYDLKDQRFYKVDTSESQLEHIMPQTKSKSWNHINYIDEEYDYYCNLIGNITYTDYNPINSNKSFQHKKNDYEKCKIPLNEYVIQQDEWDVNKIIERSNLLFQIAIKIWPLPTFSQDLKNTKFYIEENYYEIFELDEYEDYLDQLNYYPSSISKEIYIDFLKTVKKIYPDIFITTSKSYINLCFDKDKTKSIAWILFYKDNIRVLFELKDVNNDSLLQGKKHILKLQGHWGRKTHYIELSYKNLNNIENLVKDIPTLNAKIFNNL